MAYLVAYLMAYLVAYSISYEKTIKSCLQTEEPDRWLLFAHTKLSFYLRKRVSH